MTSDLEQFLAGVRDADNPSREDEERVMRGVRAALAAGVISSVTVKASALSSVSGKASLFGGLSAVGTKLGAVAVGGALALGAGYQLAASNVGEDAPSAASQSSKRSSARYPQSLPSPGASVARPDRDAGEHQEKRTAKHVPETRARAAPVGAKASQSSAPTSASRAPASLEAELQLLSEVQAALRRGDGNEALAKLEAHETKDRQLSAERSAARIAALCAVGRVEEARNQARAFLREHPRSVQRAAVLGSCASPTVVDEP